MRRDQRRRLSKRLRQAIRTAGIPQYKIARRGKVDRSVLSSWMNGIAPVRAGDPRVIRLGALFGLSAEDCFEPAPRRGDLKAAEPLIDGPGHSAAPSASS